DASRRPQAVEFEYTRHGTQALIANFEVATGQILAPSIGDTRTEADFLAHLTATVDTDPQGEWIFICDQLNIHQSASLVEFVAQRCEIKTDLGHKGQDGILKSMASRAAFLQDSHAPHPLRLYPQALLLAQPSRDLVRHSDPTATQARTVLIYRGAQSTDPRIR
ncbi:hypothetical protein ThidrDRAFT_4706, partial [Thiorhodococcus drewsii AZ1]